jgi:hypothetical protein
MIEVKASGDFNQTEKFLAMMKQGEVFSILEQYGQIGRDALSAATPIDSGLTAESWTYEVINKKGVYEIIWRNTNLKNGIPVAILIQYGHATGTGGWVEGLDYVNPVIRPLFKQIADDVWERVKHG